MPQQSFGQTEDQYADAQIESLAQCLNASGVDASYWHSGGGVMVVNIPTGDGIEVIVGLANFPTWGYDVCIDAYECSEPHLRADAESLLLELSAGMPFESERVQKLVKWIRDDIARTI